jgi:hypothetical protein
LTSPSLEGALVDSDPMTIAALDPMDPRTFQTLVAGPAALLMAKVFKIHERQDTDRQSDKDALDIYRLLRGTGTSSLADRYRRIRQDHMAGANAGIALERLRELFGSARAPGIQMTLRATAGLVDPDETTNALVILAGDLLEAI